MSHGLNNGHSKPPTPTPLPVVFPGAKLVMRSPETKKSFTLHWNIMFCPRHMQPYAGRAEQAQRAILWLMEAVMSDIRFHDTCLGDTDNFEKVALAFSPICCYMGENVMDKLYADTGVERGDSAC